jgi:hypothetical protein
MIKKFAMAAGAFALSMVAAVTVVFAQTPTTGSTDTTPSPSPTTTVPAGSPSTGRAQ